MQKSFQVFNYWKIPVKLRKWFDAFILYGFFFKADQKHKLLDLDKLL